MKIIITSIFFVAISVMVTMIVMLKINNYNHVQYIMNRNLQDSEKIKFLLDSINSRLKNDDKDLVYDLTNFNKEY